MASRRATVVVPVIRQSPVASTFWQYPAGWMNRSGRVSIWSGVIGVYTRGRAGKVVVQSPRPRPDGAGGAERP